jgi:PAS domain S-box-containing protein
MTEPPQSPADPPPTYRWRALFQRAADPLFVLDRRRRLLYANPAWQQLTGIPLAEARGLVCKRYPAAEPGSREAVLLALNPPADALAGKVTWSRRAVLRPGGRQTWEVAFLPLRGPEGLLCLLGRVTSAQEAPTTAAPLPPRLAALGERPARWHRLEYLGEGSPALCLATEQLRLASRTAAPVLLVGEPGVGKEWAARVIHQHSGLGARAFVALDCRRLPTAALAALLFDGHALAARAGAGALYLREPQCLPRELQARLAALAAAAPGTCEGQRAGPRLLAGCSADPREEVRLGHLLADLHAALGVLTVWLPPLRERGDELVPLARRLLERAGTGDRRPSGLTPEAWEVLRAWSWPGNVRELYAALQGAATRAGGDLLDVEDLPWYIRSAPPPPSRSLPLQTLLQEVERRLIRLALKASRNNRSKAAKLLEVWRPYLWRRMKALGLDEPEA